MSLFKKVKSFAGGVHPKEFKELSKDKAFELMPIPKTVVVPLSQHIGKPAKAIVGKKEEVKAGQIIAEQEGFISSPIYSSVSGKVLKIQMENSASGFPKESIILESSEENEIEYLPKLNPENITPDEIRERIKVAGIVGQGGAAFPTYVKLTPPEDKKIDCIILNGCECEPYLTRDYRFMVERTEELVAGLKLIMKALGVEKGAIGVEDNKPEAIQKINDVVKNEPNITVEALETKYPQGAEKMLIKAVVNREVPPGKLPLDVGVVIQNIGTALAIYDAIVKGEPQITAALTVSGLGINEPKNLLVPVGTPISDVIKYCGGVKENATKVVIGGPMMGVAQFDFSAPVMKATSGILVLTEKEVQASEETPCLKCGKCVEGCPVNLTPTKLARYSQLEKLEEAEDLGIMVCMECGTCSYTCPANIPLVQWIRLGKQRVANLQRERKSA